MFNQQEFNPPNRSFSAHCCPAQKRFETANTQYSQRAGVLPAAKLIPATPSTSLHVFAPSANKFVKTPADRLPRHGPAISERLETNIVDGAKFILCDTRSLLFRQATTLFIFFPVSSPLRVSGQKNATSALVQKRFRRREGNHSRNRCRPAVGQGGQGHTLEMPARWRGRKLFARIRETHTQKKEKRQRPAKYSELIRRGSERYSASTVFLKRYEKFLFFFFLMPGGTFSPRTEK